MRHIKKGREIAEFADFVQREHPASWEDIHHARTAGLYQKCRDHILMTEQNFLGGYTECRLSNNKNIHIDHFKKKGMNWPVDVTFDWGNFVVEDRNAEYGACYKDKNTHSMADYARLLNPMTDYPETMMTYQPNGKIVALKSLDTEECDKVEFTVGRFNLNHEKLRKMREKVIRLIVDTYSSLSDDEVREAMKEEGFPTVVDWALTIRGVL